MTKINWAKVLLTGVIFTVISFVLRQVETMLTLKYYMDPAYFGVWSKFMMPTAGPPPTSFMIMSIVFTFVSGVSITLIYYYMRDILAGKGFMKAFYFADILIATSFVFFTLPVYLLFNVPVGLLIWWFVDEFIVLVAGSWVIVKIIK